MFSFAFVLPEKQLNRDTKLIVILRRQFCITLTALVLRIGRSREYGIYFLPTSRQYNAELPSQNRN